MNCLLQWLYWNSYVNESLTVACRGKTHSIPSEWNKKAVIQNLWCAYMHKSTLCICLLGCVYTASLNAQIRSFDHIQFFWPICLHLLYVTHAPMCEWLWSIANKKNVSMYFYVLKKTLVHQGCIYFVKVKSERDIRPSMEFALNILGICALQLTHPKCHTQQWTHTHPHRDHTPGAFKSTT